MYEHSIDGDRGNMSFQGSATAKSESVICLCCVPRLRGGKLIGGAEGGCIIKPYDILEGESY